MGLFHGPHYVTAFGKTQMISEWSRETGLPDYVILWRLKRWPVEKALTTPIRPLRWKTKDGIPPPCIRDRLLAGWSIQDATTKPVRPWKKQAQAQP